MARLVGPEAGSRLVYTLRGDNGLGSASGFPAVVYADEAGTVPADILTMGGDPVAGGEVTVEATSLLPLFQFPDDAEVVYVSINGGPVSAVYARRPAEANPFEGRRWVALGTSITSMGLYAEPLADALGVTLTNLGVSGATLSRGITNDVNFFGNGQVSAQLYSVPADAELVTLEVGVNDFRSSVRLGAFGDKDDTTFYGALWAALDFLRTYRPNSLVVCLTPYGFTEATFSGTWGTANGWGRYLRDYQRAIHEVAAVFGVPVIPVGEESGIGVQTATSLMSDGLHLNASGGEWYADFVAPRLKQSFTAWPPAVSTPSVPAAPTWSSTNAVANGDFETNVASWSFQNGASFVQSGAGEPAATGTRSARFTTAAASTGPPVAFTWSITGLTVGATYRARVFCRMPAASMPPSGPPTVTCRLNYMDAGNGTTLAVNTAHQLLLDEWTEFVMVGVVPVGTTQANVQVRYPTTTPAGFYFHVDAVSLNVRTN